MKKTKFILLSAVAVFLTLSSCGDVTDLENTREVSSTAVWSSDEAADMYITASYKTFSDVSQVAESRSQYFDSYSDLMKSTSWDQYNHGYNKSLLQLSAFSKGGAGALDCWSSVYDRIRRANVLLNEITSYGVENFGEEWSEVRRAEVRLCRAYSYYRLIRVYGGIVLRTENSGTNGGVDDGAVEADIHRARLSEADSWKFVMDELQWAAERLPESWGSVWEGRATKRTAYGLLSRMALHAKEWKIAVDAAEKVKELGAALAPDYAKVFQVNGGQDNSSEILFALSYKDQALTHKYDLYNRPFGDRAAHNTTVYAEHVPTAELADLYEFSDGTEFNWDTYSGKFDNPYTEREPRFHATILYNGAKWEGREIQTYTDGSDSFKAFTQNGHTDGHTCTGYYLRKYLQENYTTFISNGSTQYDAVLRYAEVLLNKAEAYAELGYEQNSDKALAALNEVRGRVGLPAKTKTDAPNKEAFMTLLRKERCVELAGEGFRYWDLRRWRLAEKVINGQTAHGVEISKLENGSFSYKRVSCDGGADAKRVFLEKYYYFSIPTIEIGSNKLCEDNPLW
ncbi:RagB/SusD family nutrient uptake outer membrane protein [Dysgonomonas sp. Marseille-P4361]|uniref:RagB/SusD family nutrient uptake outer membrane protein n=1 Tax=Dysgonomonas sp. Marseille-P4361 TaxID=2161820 RepID=UPI000D559DCB|nr:RagB/SusD family nutrient uptake outer membrane protein [Dysgonomonas sp. Marseille-P4361]